MLPQRPDASRDMKDRCIAEDEPQDRLGPEARTAQAQALRRKGEVDEVVESFPLAPGAVGQRRGEGVDAPRGGDGGGMAVGCAFAVAGPRTMMLVGGLVGLCGGRGGRVQARYTSRSDESSVVLSTMLRSERFYGFRELLAGRFDGRDELDAFPRRGVRGEVGIETLHHGLEMPSVRRSSSGVFPVVMARIVLQPDRSTSLSRG